MRSWSSACMCVCVCRRARVSVCVCVTFWCRVSGSASILPVGLAHLCDESRCIFELPLHHLSFSSWAPEIHPVNTPKENVFVPGPTFIVFSLPPPWPDSLIEIGGPALSTLFRLRSSLEGFRSYLCPRWPVCSLCLQLRKKKRSLFSFAADLLCLFISIQKRELKEILF